MSDLRSTLRTVPTSILLRAADPGFILHECRAEVLAKYGATWNPVMGVMGIPSAVQTEWRDLARDLGKAIDEEIDRRFPVMP